MDDQIDLKKQFQMQMNQTKILLDGIKQICVNSKKRNENLNCKLIDSAFGEHLKESATELLQGEQNLKNTLSSIQTAVFNLQESFDQFQVNEDAENYFPNYEFTINEDIEKMNQSNITRTNIECNSDLLQITSIIDQILEGDEDFTEISNEQLDKIPIDPFTQKEIENPVKNKVCNHYYDKDGITSYITQRAKNNKAPRCPTTGCTNKTQCTFNDLVDDLQMKEKIDRLRHNM